MAQNLLKTDGRKAASFCIENADPHLDDESPESLTCCERAVLQHALQRKIRSCPISIRNGAATLLHRLGRPNTDLLDVELERYADVNPIALVLPSLYSELERPALQRIVEVLQTVRYLNEIVI